MAALMSLRGRRKSAYTADLQKSLGLVLTDALSEVCRVRPSDPIEYLAKYLYKVADNQIYFQEKALFEQNVQAMAVKLDRDDARKILFGTNIKLQLQDIKRTERGQSSITAARRIRYAKALQDLKVTDAFQIVQWEDDQAPSLDDVSEDLYMPTSSTEIQPRRDRRTSRHTKKHPKFRRRTRTESVLSKRSPSDTSERSSSLHGSGRRGSEYKDSARSRLDKAEEDSVRSLSFPSSDSDSASDLDDVGIMGYPVEMREEKRPAAKLKARMKTKEEARLKPRQVKEDTVRLEKRQEVRRKDRGGSKKQQARGARKREEKEITRKWGQAESGPEEWSEEEESFRLEQEETKSVEVGERKKQAWAETEEDEATVLFQTPEGDRGRLLDKEEIWSASEMRHLSTADDRRVGGWSAKAGDKPRLARPDDSKRSWRAKSEKSPAKSNRRRDSRGSEKSDRSGSLTKDRRGPIENDGRESPAKPDDKPQSARPADDKRSWKAERRGSMARADHRSSRGSIEKGRRGGSKGSVEEGRRGGSRGSVKESRRGGSRGSVEEGRRGDSRGAVEEDRRRGFGSSVKSKRKGSLSKQTERRGSAKVDDIRSKLDVDTIGSLVDEDKFGSPVDVGERESLEEIGERGSPVEVDERASPVETYESGSLEKIYARGSPKKIDERESPEEIDEEEGPEDIDERGIPVDSQGPTKVRGIKKRRASGKGSERKRRESLASAEDGESQTKEEEKESSAEMDDREGPKKVHDRKRRRGLAKADLKRRGSFPKEDDGSGPMNVYDRESTWRADDEMRLAEAEDRERRDRISETPARGRWTRIARAAHRHRFSMKRQGDRSIADVDGEGNWASTYDTERLARSETVEDLVRLFDRKRKGDKESSTRALDRDGSVRTLDRDGSIRTLDRDGSVRMLDRDTSVRSLRRDTSVRALERDGSVRTLDRDMSVRALEQDRSVRPLERDRSVKTRGRERSARATNILSSARADKKERPARRGKRVRKMSIVVSEAGSTTESLTEAPRTSLGATRIKSLRRLKLTKEASSGDGREVKICRWYLDHPRVLVCDHPVLGQIRCHGPQSYAAGDLLDQFISEDFHHQSLYDHEIYTVSNPHFDDTLYQTRMIKWEAHDWL